MYSWYSSSVFTPYRALLLGVPLSFALHFAQHLGVLSTVALAGGLQTSGKWLLVLKSRIRSYPGGDKYSFVDDVCPQYQHCTDEDKIVKKDRACPARFSRKSREKNAKRKKIANNRLAHTPCRQKGTVGRDFFSMVVSATDDRLPIDPTRMGADVEKSQQPRRTWRESGRTGVSEEMWHLGRQAARIASKIGRRTAPSSIISPPPTRRCTKENWWMRRRLMKKARRTIHEDEDSSVSKKKTREKSGEQSNSTKSIRAEWIVRGRLKPLEESKSERTREQEHNQGSTSATARE